MKELLENNKRWAESIIQSNPNFFQQLSLQQKPKYLWIGCSDSRVPANQILGLLPGEVFVHRNVANLVVHSDLNCLSTLQFAVDVLKVKHIIVCGHYGCGGVQAALNDTNFGLITNWLRHVQDVAHKHHIALHSAEQDELRARRLSELNVIEQCRNVCQTTITQAAWERGQDLSVHSLIYGIEDGILHDLGFSVNKAEEVVGHYSRAIIACTSLGNSRSKG